MPEEDEFEKLVDDADYVAFDVYDTAVVRPFLRPTDLFGYVEKISGRKGFASSRVEAEKKARRELKKEITLDEIYSFLPPGFRNLKGREVEKEILLARKDGRFALIYEYARRKGKKILMVSDMYLPKRAIAEVLAKLGIDYDFLYVSSDCGKTKYDGSMYDYILGDRGIPSPHRLLMVGDDRRSDFEIPRKKGIPAYRWTPLVERYREAYPREATLAGKGIDQAIVAGADMLMWQDENSGEYWRELGCRYGGPMALQFALHIVDNVSESTDRILFLSRDAYNIWKVYKGLCAKLGRETAPNSYFYASRMLMKLFEFEDESDKDSLESVFEYLYRTGKAEAMEIPPGNATEHAKIFREKKDEVLRAVSEARERYLGYLESQTEGCGRVLLVDATTMRFTAQRFMELHLPGVAGCYYAVTGRSDLPHNAYCNRSGDHLTSSLVNFAEYCFASGEPPVCDVDGGGNAVYSERPPEEALHAGRAAAILEGEMRYSDFICDLYGDPPRISHEAVDGWCRALFSHEGRKGDPDGLLGALWAVNTQHTEFLHVVLRGRDLLRIGMMKASKLAWKLRKRR